MAKQEVTQSREVLVSNGTVTLNVTVHESQSRERVETVILLHGGPGVPDDFPFVVAALTPKYRVIHFEQRGLGKSSNPSGDYSMEAYIEDIEAIARHFQLDKFHLFGHSWGGLYAQIYADAHPERLTSLFLSSPSSGTNSLWQQTENEVLAYNQARCSSQWAFLTMGWYSLLGALGSDSACQSLFLIVLDNYNRDYGQDAPVITQDHVRSVRADPVNKTRPNIVKYKALAKMENPSFPIMITYGDTDIYGDSKAAVPLRYPTAKHIVIPKCGHLPWWHNPKAFQSILDQFYGTA